MSSIGSIGSGFVNFWNASKIGISDTKSRDIFGRIPKEIDEEQARNNSAKSADPENPLSAVKSAPVVFQVNTANTLWETQSFAQSEESQAVDAEEVSAFDKPSAEEEFLDYINRPTEDLLREAILKELGLTEEEVNNLDPKERVKIEAKIKELLEQKIEESMKEEGFEIDISGVKPVNPIPDGAFELFS